MVVSGIGSLKMILPWVVMQELDYLKDGKGSSLNKLVNTICNEAKKAVNYLYNVLSSKDSSIIGQTAREVIDACMDRNSCEKCFDIEKSEMTS